jgi:hypothetical protein
MHPDFSAAKIKKSAQITRANAVYLHSFLAPELGGSELSESLLGRFISTPVPTD